ncbi:hypothetical protein NT239_11030 [Chitinibacter sp. SCUT-21]|uniref:hypothetical protein n=1 Tax=Chitinibacter sp. SCUT-21 TaxID=2970891 RepID=UPI0035A5DAD3
MVRINTHPKRQNAPIVCQFAPAQLAKHQTKPVETTPKDSGKIFAMKSCNLKRQMNSAAGGILHDHRKSAAIEEVETTKG